MRTRVVSNGRVVCMGNANSYCRFQEVTPAVIEMPSVAW